MRIKLLKGWSNSGAWNNGMADNIETKNIESK